jgi:hypothetical protein
MNNIFKKVITSFVFLFVFLAPISQALAVYVNGYYRSNGTYVNGYERTAADSNPYNNYSYPGNYNPNTGSITGGNPSTYLNNYYNNSYSGGYSSSYSSPNYSYLTTPSCPFNSYYDGVSSCQCNYGYVVSGSSCVNASLYCSDKIGIMSQYNSASKTCECMSGYEYNGSSCVYKSTTPSSYSTSTYDSYSSAYNNCPLNSHTSSTDSTKCSCDFSYEPNSTKDGCVLSIIKTPDQLCKNSFGPNSIPADTKNDKGETQCICGTGYEWASDRKSCIQSVVVINTPPTCTLTFYPKTITLGKTVTSTLKITGTVSKVAYTGTGFLAFSDTYSGDVYSNFFNLLNSGKSSTQEIKPNKVGKTSQTYTITGPGGTSSCVSSFTTISKTKK